ncbi:MAG: LamG-like jellyroll fold domain-containing protein, partial [Cyanobacteria bacterium J06649_4]
MQRTALVTKSYGGQNGDFFDWKNLSFDVNLGQGYDYLMFQVNTSRVSNSKDYVAIDNLSLQGKASSTEGSSLPPTTVPNPVEPNPINPNPRNPSSPKSPLPGPTFPKGLSPVARLSFDEGSGKLAVDTSTKGRTNNGLLRRNAVWTAGKSGQAVALDGQKSVVVMNKSRDIDLGTHEQRTISLWFKADSLSAKGKQVIYEEGSRTRGLNMYIEDNLLHFGGWSTPGGKWKGTWIDTQQHTQNVRADQWHHVALVLNGSGR